MSTFVSVPNSSVAPHRGLPSRSAESETNWKAELQARLQAHRQRRAEASSPTVNPASTGPYRGLQGSAVAARVAERYRAAPSYQALLAASAEAAQTAAEAALEAHAAAEAVLAAWQESSTQPLATPPSGGLFTDAPRPEPARSADQKMSSCELNRPGLRAPQIAAIEHPVPLPTRAALPPRPSVAARARTLVDAFAEAVVPAAQSLPAKLIEFPRELVAPRKQRPRLAEGPLLAQEAPGVHLRIFEVGTGEVGTGEAAAGEASDGHAYDSVATETTLPSELSEAPQTRVSRHMERYGGQSVRHDEDREPLQAAKGAPRAEGGWGSIRLGEHPRAEAPVAPEPALRRAEHGYETELVPALHDLAPLSSRLMSALVDGGLVFGSFLVAVLLFASCTPHVPAGKAALGLALLALCVLAAFYGWLFMSFGGGSTPGMRYTRIAICTFADSNPTRRELQGRVPATALALLPLGLGVFWAILDEDKLGWHDRMTRTYQRSYK